MLLNRFSENFAHEREPTAEDDNLRVRQMHHMRKGEREILRRLIQDAMGEGIVALDGAGQVPGFRTGVFLNEGCQNRIWLGGDGFTNAAIHRPTRTTLFHDDTAFIQADMADLCFAGNGAMVNILFDDEPTPHATAESDVKNRVRFFAGSEDCFGQRGGVRIVVHTHRNAGDFMHPGAKVEITPAFDMMGKADPAVPPINRTAEADPDGGDAMLVLVIIQRLRDLLANARAASLLQDLEATAIDDVRVNISQDNLQFGAADFYANVKTFVHKIFAKLAEFRTRVIENRVR